MMEVVQRQQDACCFSLDIDFSISTILLRHNIGSSRAAKILIGMETSKTVEASVKLQFVSRILLKTLGIVCVLQSGNDICNYSSEMFLLQRQRSNPEFLETKLWEALSRPGCQGLQRKTQDFYPRHHGS